MQSIPAEPLVMTSRRALRESERRRPWAPIEERPRAARWTTAPRPPRRPRTPLRHRIFALAAMVAVGGMAVTTSIPALAFSSTTIAAPSTATNSGSQSAQSVAVGPVATLAAVQRDGYTVAEAPKLVPATYGTPTAVSRTGGVDSGQLSGQGWALPVAGFISDVFGPRPDKPLAGVGDFHEGADIAAGCGHPVSAATAGTVISVGWYGSYGNWVLIDHGDGVQTGYAHNSAILVNEGQTVVAGETIAEVGSTGASSGCHLHFETRVDDSQINPQPFMSARGITLG